MILKLKMFRLLRGKSQFQLSLQTGLPSYRLSDFETGRRVPSQGELEKLSRVLGVSAGELLLELSEESLVSSHTRKARELEEASE